MPQSLFPRLLLTALLSFGSEVLIWSNPIGRSALEWLILIPAYFALSAVLLDMMVRYSVRDIFGVIMLAGAYGLLASLLLHPQTALADVPRTLITRVMGLHTVAGLAVLGALLANRVGLLIGAGVGLLWGIWIRSFPVEVGYGEVSLMTMLTFGAVGLLLVLILAVLTRRTQINPPELLLSGRAWVVIAFFGIALFTLRIAQGAIDGLSMVVIGVLLAFCWAMLWFQVPKKPRTMLDRVPAPLVIIFAGVLFLGLGVVGYNLPVEGDVTLFSVMSVAFLVFGLLWLPTVSLVLGARAYARSLRAGGGI